MSYNRLPANTCIMIHDIMLIMHQYEQTSNVHCTLCYNTQGNTLIEGYELPRLEQYLIPTITLIHGLH
jgi:hypothetical protein